MCGRYSLFVQPGDIEERFDATFSFAFEPRYNAAPGQSLPVIAGDAPGSIQPMQWGFVPRWADDAADAHINARAETVAEKPAFAEAYERRRCLVLADGFYEWSKTEDGQPYRVTLSTGEPFAMAGVWERWTPDTLQTGLGDFAGDEPTGEADPIETFAIVTTEPNAVVEPHHDRMAVVLSPSEEAAWLEGEDVPLDPYPAEEMDAYPISRAVNDPANDSPEIVQPLEG